MNLVLCLGTNSDEINNKKPAQNGVQLGRLIMVREKVKFRMFFVLFSRVLRDSTPRYVGLSVGRSPFWAAAPKGPMTYAFTQEKFLLLLILLHLRPPPLKLIF